MDRPQWVTTELLRDLTRPEDDRISEDGFYLKSEAAPYMDELETRLTTAETLLSRWLEGCENGWSWSPISDTRAFLTPTREEITTEGESE